MTKNKRIAPDRPQEGGSYRRAKPGAPLHLIEQTKLPDGAFRPDTAPGTPAVPEVEGSVDTGSAETKTGQEG